VDHIGQMVSTKRRAGVLLLLTVSSMKLVASMTLSMQMMEICGLLISYLLVRTLDAVLLALLQDLRSDFKVSFGPVINQFLQKLSYKKRW
jgi:hypothetical protein